MEHIKRKADGGYYIYFAALATSLTSFSTGPCFSWPTSLLLKFQSDDAEANPIGHPATTLELAWVVSAMGLGLIFGPALAMACLRFFTKKRVLLIAMAPILVSHVICYFATRANEFVLARLMMGFGSGMVWTVLGTFLAEIAEDRIRGILCCLPGVMSNIGSLMVYAVGPLVSIPIFSIVLLVPILVFYLAFGLFVPESPYDLLLKGDRTRAENSLKTLRRTDNVEKELDLVQETIDNGQKTRVQLADLFRDKALRKGLTICIALMVFQQFSGILAVVSYAQIIFENAGNFVSPSASTVIMGIVATISNIGSTCVVDKFGRKFLLTCSCALVALSLFTLGLYFQLLDSAVDVSSLGWLPLSCVILFMISFNFALGVIPWVVTGEVFHSSVKDLASTVTATCNFVCTYSVTMCFPYLVESLGMAGTFWIFAVFMLVGVTFCRTVLPETKCKSFQEIQQMLSNPVGSWNEPKK